MKSLNRPSLDWTSTRRRRHVISTTVICVCIAVSCLVPQPVLSQEASVLTITKNTTLDPNKKYSRIIIEASNVTVDGNGAWIVGATEGNPKTFQGDAVFAKGVSGVTLKNLRAKGWETGLHVTDGKNWLIEGCEFSNNFHDPDFGWGENGRRGGIVLERVAHSTLRHNKANQVWDACVLVDCNDNVVEDNDFSHTSNTCLKLWTSCHNTIRKNNLSYGIRINPGEVHARDSTSVLIESGSCNNRLIDNDCTHGGDGIFVRVLNGWCSTDNWFEGNDCSYANNNGIECWAPRNQFVKNRANHCSYGFWLGGSDQSRLIDNEASYNGLPSGAHNSPHLPANGHAGIVFMFGSSSHTVAKGNVCNGNNGAGVALLGDIDSKGKKWQAYHWILEENTMKDNRWGLYAQYADWIVVASNRFENNSIQDIFRDESVTRFQAIEEATKDGRVGLSVKIEGPTSVKVGKPTRWRALSPDAPVSTPFELSKAATSPVYRWDLGKGDLQSGDSIEHTFERVGFHRIGLNVTQAGKTELAWKDIYAVRDVQEIGTEGQASEWYIEDFDDRTRSREQVSKADFVVAKEALLGNSSLGITIRPYRGFRAALTFPKSKAHWLIKDKTQLSFWMKAINEDTTGWQGGPFVTLYGDDGKPYYLEPKGGRDLMREAPNSESREGWRLWEIPLRGNDLWEGTGTLPDTLQRLSIALDSWGAPTLRVSIDGLAIE